MIGQEQGHVRSCRQWTARYYATLLPWFYINSEYVVAVVLPSLVLLLVLFLGHDRRLVQICAWLRRGPRTPLQDRARSLLLSRTTNAPNLLGQTAYPAELSWTARASSQTQTSLPPSTSAHISQW